MAAITAVWLMYHVHPYMVHLSSYNSCLIRVYSACKSVKAVSLRQSRQFWEKAPGQNWEKMMDLTAKLGEINHNNDIEHNKGSKIYPQNQFILDANHTT